MQAFHFSLEKVLDHRKTIQQEAKRTYAQKQRYLLALNATIDEVQNKMFHVKQELAESLSVVVEAQQERKIVEKLREKQFAEYIYEEQLEEQKQLDEFGNRALFS